MINIPPFLDTSHSIGASAYQTHTPHLIVCTLLMYCLTGTPLGDPIEVGAAASVFFPAATLDGRVRQPGPEGAASAWDDTTSGRPFAWSTIKGYGGHQEAAAGESRHQDGASAGRQGARH